MGATKQKKPTARRKKSKGLRLRSKVSSWQAILLILIVVVVGGFFAYRSFAYSPTAPCAAGSRSLGYADAYKNGKSYRIRLCRIDWFPSSGKEDGGWVRVASNASGNWVALLRAADKANITLRASSSFRSNSYQAYLYNCDQTNKCNGGNDAAEPGYSNHQSGEAVDIDIVPGDGNDPPLTKCLSNPKAYPVYDWLSKNAYKYKRYARVASECWHWSPTGY